METTINPQWTRVKDINIAGTSLQLELPEITNADIKKLFGELPAGANAHTKYSDESIYLVNNIEKPVESIQYYDGRGIYTLYTLYGVWRIGGFPGNKFTQQLRDYIVKNSTK